MIAASGDPTREERQQAECVVVIWRNRRLFVTLRLAVACYVLTGAIVVLALVFSMEAVKPSSESPVPLYHRDLAGRLSVGDAVWFKTIIEEGYSYDPSRPSTIAYFPAYPLMASVLVKVTGIRAELASLVISQILLFAAFFILATYTMRRFPSSDEEFQIYVLYSLGLFPTTFFLRTACADSCFLFLAVLAMYAMEVSLPQKVTAAIIGLASAAHPLGAILIIPFLFHIRDRSPRAWHFLTTSAQLLPVCLSGVLFFVLYQQWAFGEPLAFIKAPFTEPIYPIEDSRLFRLLSFKPLWSVYDPSTTCHWSRHPPRFSPWFNVHFAAPLFYLGSLILIFIGAILHWLSKREWIFGVAVLVFPYLFLGHQSCAMGLARFERL